MGQPTANDPFGEKPDIGSFAAAIEAVVDERIMWHVRGRTGPQFDKVTDIALVQELLARGWAVFRPSTKG